MALRVFRCLHAGLLTMLYVAVPSTLILLMIGPINLLVGLFITVVFAIVGAVLGRTHWLRTAHEGMRYHARRSAYCLLGLAFYLYVVLAVFRLSQQLPHYAY